MAFRRSTKVGPIRFTFTHNGVSPSLSTGKKGSPGFSLTKRGAYFRLGNGTRFRL